MIKIIEAVCATSEELARKRIFMDTSTGLIKKIESAFNPLDKIDYYYNDDILLFAGMGDIHIHAREDESLKNIYKEDFHSTCCAAKNGGLVHVADMPNNPIPPIDDKSYLIKARQALNLEVPILMYAGIGRETRPLSFEVPYKAYMGPSVGELYFKNNEELDKVLNHYKNKWVSFHCEDPEILESHKNENDHFLRRPVIAETMATDTALALIKKYQLKGKLCHYSAGDGLKAIKKARLEGVDVTCEVTPQHLYFSHEKILKRPCEEQILFQMNPPIRSELDSFKLLEALKNGEIDFLATDHAPHSEEEKKAGMSGMPGLDSYAGFVTWLLVTQKVSPQIIAKITAENPGDFFNQFNKKILKKLNAENPWGLGLGYLKENYSASFTLLNLNAPSLFKKEHLKSKAHWSPFIGETFPGKLHGLFIKGELQLS